MFAYLRPATCGKITKIRYTLCKIREIPGYDINEVLLWHVDDIEVYDHIWVQFRHGFPMILWLISDSFLASILGDLFYSILLNLGSKMEPKWVPKSLKEHPKSRLYPQGSILAVLGSFWYHFGTPRTPFSEPLVHFAIILVQFWCAFRALFVFVIEFSSSVFRVFTPQN